MSWYVAATHHASEALASAEIGRQGFETFLPLCVVQRTAYRGRRFSSIVPYFPGYLFVEFDVRESAWRAIASTRGVKGLISSNAESPTPLPRHVVPELRSRCDARSLVIDDQGANDAVCKFLAGDAVRVLSGPFAGHEGEVLDPAARRVRVLLSLFGRATCATFRPTEIERA